MAPRSGPVDDLLLAESRRLTTLAGRTRNIAPTLHVGTLGGQRICLPLARIGRTDHALRADLITSALERLGEPADHWAWLTRSGPLSAGDTELEWRAASETAFARHGVGEASRRAFYVVTRHGWFDVSGTAGRSWRRLRPDPAPVAAPPASPDPFEGWPIVM